MIKHYDRFVIASCSHSGTTWMARTLSACGLFCSHEQVFSLDGNYNPHLWVLGDASLAAVDHLTKVPPNTLILHQLRHPLDAISGWAAAVDGMDDPRDFLNTWEGKHGYRELLHRYSWPAGISAAYWCAHNRRIAAEATKAMRLRPSVGYLDYRVEAVDFEFLTHLGALLGHSVRPDMARRALANTPKRIKPEESNAAYRQRRAMRELISFASLPEEKGVRDQVVSLAQRFGYVELS